MKRQRRVIWLGLVVIPLVGLMATALSCTKQRTSSEREAIKAIVLRSKASDQSRRWHHLNSKWSDYGLSQVMVDHTSLSQGDITLEKLNASASDVVVIAFATDLTESEVNAVVQYVEAGHGLIITGGTFRFETHRELIPLVGFSMEISGHTDYGDSHPGNSIAIRPSPLFNRLASYTTASTTYYTQGDWNRDGYGDGPSDWEKKRTSTDTRIVGYIWNERGWSVISTIEKSNYRAVFAGHSPIGDTSPSFDDYQFVYNAILFCGKR